MLKLPPHSASKPVHAQVKIVYHVFLLIARGNYVLFAVLYIIKGTSAVPFFIILEGQPSGRVSPLDRFDLLRALPDPDKLESSYKIWYIDSGARFGASKSPEGRRNLNG